MDKVDPYIGLAGRILIAAMFILSGLDKISTFAGTQGFMEAKGVPGLLLPVVILLETGGGLAIVVGWQTRFAALLLAGFCLITALLFHFHPGEPLQIVMFMKNLSIAGGFLILVRFGAGEFSLDHWRRKSAR